MPKITHEDATAIAKKLSAEYREGGKHTIAIISYQGKRIAQFGIRHDRTAGHDYVSDQIYMSKGDCIEFGRCNISYDNWVSRMKKLGHITTEPKPPTEPPKKIRKRHR